MRGRPLVVAAALALTACNGDQDGRVGDAGLTDTVRTETVGGTPGTGGATGMQGEARAALLNAQGDTVGTATFREVGQGVQVAVSVRGLPPGEKGIHVHQVGRCDPPTFESAGGHFNPEGREHGFENPEGPHAGDLRNLTIGQDGTVQQELTLERATLREGANSLFDADGSALVIHAGPDDYRTDPSGNSGDRIACGVITRGN
jgi:superoxide dismutase, Cu-Zn family